MAGKRVAVADHSAKKLRAPPKVVESNPEWERISAKMTIKGMTEAFPSSRKTDSAVEKTRACL